jgi:hypothetical protein
MSEVVGPDGAGSSPDTVKKEFVKPGQWQKKSLRHQTNKSAAVKFEGKVEGLKGHVFDRSSSQNADQFMRTQRAIAEFVGGTVLKHGGGDMRRTVETLERKTFPLPPDPNANATRGEERRFDQLVASIGKREDNYNENFRTLYTIVLSQCTEALREYLKTLPDYEDMSESLDGLALLNAIKVAAYNFQSHKYLPQAIYENMHQMSFGKQQEGMSNEQYLEKFQNVVDIVQECGGSVGHFPGIFDMVAAEQGNDRFQALTVERKAEVRAIAKERLSRYTEQQVSCWQMMILQLSA